MPLHKFKFLVKFIYYPFLTKCLVYFQMSARKRSQIEILNENTKNVMRQTRFAHMPLKLMLQEQKFFSRLLTSNIQCIFSVESNDIFFLGLNPCLRGENSDFQFFTRFSFVVTRCYLTLALTNWHLNTIYATHNGIVGFLHYHSINILRYGI